MRPFSKALLAAAIVAAINAAGGPVASAQTYGFAAMQPGSLNHTASSAMAKVLKEKGNLNTLVQPTAGSERKGSQRLQRAAQSFLFPAFEELEAARLGAAQRQGGPHRFVQPPARRSQI